MPTDINNMREDAIRRARDMYSRATRNQNAVKREPPPIDNIKEEVFENIPETKSANINRDILGEFLQDKDKMLIIALLVILSQDEKNNTLLFALMYLLI